MNEASTAVNTKVVVSITSECATSFTARKFVVIGPVFGSDPLCAWFLGNVTSSCFTSPSCMIGGNHRLGISVALYMFAALAPGTHSPRCPAYVFFYIIHSSDHAR